MDVSYDWLKELVNIPVSPEELADKVSRTGIEVDDVKHPDAGLKKIVVGKVLAIKPHPNSDHLNLCQVDVGEDEPRQIVCGAPNVAAGQTVIVALPGARIADNVKIKKGKMRGEESLGMICALQEIGFNENVVPKAYLNGIYVFNEPLEPGSDALAALGMHDAVLDFEITPNRADALGMRGVAWEVGATYDEKPHFEEKLLTKQARNEHVLIGQLFDTYWLVQFHDNLYIIDQHAAHEKVLYEKTMASLKKREYTSQMINPPIILTLSGNEELMLKKYMEHFTAVGFEIEHFGGKEYAVRAVPANLFSIAKKELLMEMIDGLTDGVDQGTPDIINEKIASMSCKAAVKGNHAMSAAEADSLIDELLELENPYACPHGRPTIITMSKYELEKKFKRIV